MNLVAWLSLIFFLVFCSACIQTEYSTDRNNNPVGSNISLTSGGYEGRSLLNENLDEINMPKETQQFRTNHLRLSQANFNTKSDTLPYIIEYGKALAAVGQMRAAIEVFNDGLSIYTESHELLRYRGHAFLMIREINQAIEDLQQAAFYARHSSKTADFPGFEQSSYASRFTMQYNIWYYLGVAFYVKGNYDKAVSSFRKCIDASFNDDMLVGATDWGYMAYRRIGNMQRANELIMAISNATKVSFYYAHLYNVFLYKQMKTPKELMNYFKNYEYEGNSATQLYGVGSWFLHNGDASQAIQTFRKGVNDLNWNNVGVLAAESDLVTLQNQN